MDTLAVLAVAIPVLIAVYAVYRLIRGFMTPMADYQYSTETDPDGQPVTVVTQTQ